MMSSTEFLSFPDGNMNKFCEDNLLDEDDWGKNMEADLSTIYPSPSSSLESNDKNGYDESTWLLDNDLDIWLANDIDPQFVIKEEPLSPEYVCWSSNDISRTSNILEVMNSTELSQAMSNNPLQKETIISKESKINTAAKVPIIPKIPTSVMTTKPSSMPNQTVNKVKQTTFPNPSQIGPSKVRPILPSVTVSARRTANIKANNANLNSMKSVTNVILSPNGGLENKPVVSSSQQPQVVKLENGQYYVAPVLPANSKLVATLSSSHSPIMSRPCLKRPSDIKTESLFATAKDVNEYKNLKRQQRMMKNRESACLSRQRKKEHLKSLEQRVAEMAEINSRLKEENESLKQRIQSLESENKELKEQPASNILKRNPRKSTLLLAVFLLFSMNFFRTSNLDIGMKHFNKQVPVSLIHRSRTLLSYDNSNIDFYEDRPSFNKQRRYDYLDDLQKTDSTFRLKNVNPKLRNFGFSEHEEIKDIDLVSMNSENDFDCGDSFNKTHLNRINKDLEGLAKGIDKKSKRKFKDGQQVIGNATDKSHKDCNKFNGKKKIFSKLKKPTKKHHTHSKLFRNMKPKSISSKLSKEKNVTQELASLIQKNIRRKPDTFYVVSLLQDMMILPATNFSTNHRPKVTFLLPAYLPTNDTKVKSDEKLPILQIECNVLDTKLLHFESSYFSENLLTQMKSF